MVSSGALASVLSYLVALHVVEFGEGMNGKWDLWCFFGYWEDLPLFCFCRCRPGCCVFLVYVHLVSFGVVGSTIMDPVPVLKW